ncbi:MAG: alpha/beta fold hydrolase [Gammaproteobacteria bacterium]|nr:alpha/beta fold hydrolase [Gammaproteobacteria bacterium]
MSTIERDGVTIHYEQHGNDVSRPTILLSHGYSATSAMWNGQLEAFGQSFNVVTWDMRGHGRSDSPTDPAAYSEAHTVGDMAGVLDACGVDSAIIGGLSLGGYMTLAFHLAWPDRCAALMLFDTGPGYKKDEPRSAWNRTADERAAALEDKGLEGIGARAGSPHRAASFCPGAGAGRPRHVGAGRRPYYIVPCRISRCPYWCWSAKTTPVSCSE